MQSLSRCFRRLPHFQHQNLLAVFRLSECTPSHLYPPHPARYTRKRIVTPSSTPPGAAGSVDGAPPPPVQRVLLAESIFDTRRGSAPAATAPRPRGIPTFHTRSTVRRANVSVQGLSGQRRLPCRCTVRGLEEGWLPWAGWARRSAFGSVQPTFNPAPLPDAAVAYAAISRVILGHGTATGQYRMPPSGPTSA